MTAIDIKLLTELDKHPTISTTQLAKKCNISQQVAHYRLNHSISPVFGTIVNLSSLGITMYAILIQFKNPSKDILTYFENQQVYWASQVGGSYDVIVFLPTNSFKQHEAFLDNLHLTFPIKDYLSCQVLNYYFFKHKYLHNNYDFIQFGYEDTIQQIDSLDKQILQEISLNCRKSSVDIGNKLEVSYKTVLTRIKQMSKKNIIAGRACFFKLKQVNLLLISAKSLSACIEYFTQQKNTIQFQQLYGSYNVLVHIHTNDNKELQEHVVAIRRDLNIEKFEVIPLFEDIAINFYPNIE